MNGIQNASLAMIEIKDGYYLCQDSADILEWLKKYPSHYKRIMTRRKSDIYGNPMVINNKGRIDVYFIFKEVIGKEVSYMLFFIPAFVSKKFNLLAFLIRYKELKISALYKSLFKQLNLLTKSTNHLCPIYGYCEEDFIGFFYLPETFMCQN